MRRISLIILLLFNTGVFFAQNTTVGFKFGAGITSLQESSIGDKLLSDFNAAAAGVSITGQTDQTNSFIETERNAFSAGLYFNVKISKLFSFQPELLFASNGFVTNSEITREAPSTFSTYDARSIYRLNYVGTPMLFRVNTKLGHLRPYFLIGAAPMFNVSARIIHERLGLSNNAEFETSLETNGFITDQRDINFIQVPYTYDINLIGGAGFDYEFDNNVIFKIETRYSQGTQQTFNDNWATGLDTKLKGWYVFAGIGIRLNSVKVCIPPEEEEGVAEPAD